MKKRMMKVFSIVLVFVLSFSFCKSVSFAHYSGTDSYWDKFSSDYYYRQMNKEQRELYDKLYEECMEILTTDRDCTNYNEGDYFTDFVEYDESLGSYNNDIVESVIQAFMNSNPQFYFLSEVWLGNTSRIGSGSGYAYRYSLALGVYSDFRKGSDRKGYTQRFSSTIDGYMIAVNAGRTAIEKERLAHNIIATRLSYKESEHDQSSASAFLTRYSVCAGYSEGLELLLNAAGFECVPVTSEVHEWLEVKLDGTWYAVDVTWDDEDDYFGTVSEELFNVSDATLLAADRKSRDTRGSHEPEDFYYSRLNLPECNYDYPEKDPNAKPDDPDPVDPDPVDPDPVDPDPVDPDPVDPDPVDPDPVDPDPVDPDPVDPDPVEPDPIDPEPVDPSPYDPSVDGTGADDYGLTGTFTNEAGDTALFRLYNPKTGEHFYTTNVAERRILILEQGWNGEGIIGYFPTDASIDTNVMFRFYHPNTGDHHYASDPIEIRAVLAADWKPEGMAFYSLKQDKGIPIYRLYNPTAMTGIHHYTSNKAERDILVTLGWKYEGVSWYASSKDYYNVNKEEKGMDYSRLETALSAIREKTDFVPKVGLVLGSGLGGYAESGDMEVVAEVSYKDIPGFPVSTAPGHAGKYVFGLVGTNKVPVVCMQGRVHYYEGYDMEDVVLPIRLMGLMGADTIFLTNASGGINEGFSAGDLMLITDQISSFVPSPLRGENDERLGERFPDMSEIYDKDLRELARKKAKELSIDLKEGVYIQTQGPNYESPAEIQFFKAIGADAVGMSTACEAIAANHMKKKIIGISCIANLAAGISETPLSGEEVIEAGKAAAPKFTALVTAIINDIS